MRLRAFAAVSGLAYTGLVLLLTIGPVRQRFVESEADRGVLDWRSWFELTTWREGTVSEFVANVALFVPWGALAVLALGARRWMLAAAGAGALTLAIEIAQIPLARISDPRDLVANALGALLGIALGAALEAARRGSREGGPTASGAGGGRTLERASR
ncbi:VanZ family protein [Microcella alkalica]|uniref:VanZ family protein n=1 Tax=Microcella alkalica TaxID=355930 RepID=UPI00145D392A|nr:VanZ family protein [Microcella alkalica]